MASGPDGSAIFAYLNDPPRTLNGAFREARRVFGGDLMATAPHDQPLHHVIGIRFAGCRTLSRNG
jgi:hypothetical protein